MPSPSAEYSDKPADTHTEGLGPTDNGVSQDGNLAEDEENAPPVPESKLQDSPPLTLSRSSVKPLRPSNSQNDSAQGLKEIQKKYKNIVNRMKNDDLKRDDKKSIIGDTSSAVDYDKLSQMVAEKLCATTPPTVTAESLSTELVRNVVRDELEDLEFAMNRRFMHAHYTLLSQFMNHKREMEELHEKYSLNADLVQENLRLQEEVKFLRHKYS